MISRLFEDGIKDPLILSVTIDVWLAQADSLERLGREVDRDRKLRLAMARASDCCQANPSSALAFLNVARVARAAKRFDFAADALRAARRLDGTMELITYEEKLLRRERAVDVEDVAMAQNLLVYACQRCGGLIEYISVPCIYCGWYPTTLVETSHAGRLCTNYHRVWDLFGIGRAIQTGRKATEVVTNLAKVAADLMADPKSAYRQDIEQVFELIQRNQKENDFFAYYEARRCPSCKNSVPHLHDATQCPKCKTTLRVPPPLRLLDCLSALLDHLQYDFAGPQSIEFELFFRYLVSLQSKLFRYQETPSNRERDQVLDTMKKLGRFELVDGIGHIVMTDPQNIFYRLHPKVPEANKTRAEAAAAYLTHTLQLLANWMSRTRALS